MSNELLQSLFKAEYSRIVAVLCKSFGLGSLQKAEDITNDTFLIAMETWGLKGLPDNPRAWLYRVAKNKTLDEIKRKNLFKEKVGPEYLKAAYTEGPNIEVDLSHENIEDSKLKMIFITCQPLLSAQSQIALALRVLCGFGIDEIAEAFLTNKEVINKRLYRAKQKLKTAKVSFQFLSESKMINGLDNVLITIYLLFNAGYYARQENTLVKKSLCLEAIHLCYFLIRTPILNLPKVNALMALMCFHASRIPARIYGNSFLSFEEQDRSLWDKELIQKGKYFLSKSAEGKDVDKFHLEASIAYWHSSESNQQEKWKNILELYNSLLDIEYSPIVALNKVVAISKVHGNEVAIEEALKINFDQNHFYFALLGYLYTSIDRCKAISYYKKAILKSNNNSERLYLIEKINSIKKAS